MATFPTVEPRKWRTERVTDHTVSETRIEDQDMAGTWKFMPSPTYSPDFPVPQKPQYRFKGVCSPSGDAILSGYTVTCVVTLPCHTVTLCMSLTRHCLILLRTPSPGHHSVWLPLLLTPCDLCSLHPAGGGAPHTPKCKARALWALQEPVGLSKSDQ